RRGRSPRASSTVPSLGIDVVAFVLREPVQEHRPPEPPIGNHRPETDRAPLPRTRDPLLDQPAAQIGINQAVLRPLDRLAKLPVAHPLAAREAVELLGYEDPHTLSPSPTPSVI